ncbi:alpha/beta fold hydrolase [Porifericola rhodea]|uniref:bifunctional alpha/beta hydrolase/OsmC family protein n=1 Tax=Porifericola rhodea TaxID=930972 RepID=UPI002665F971|nr:bifunctional alpha/beta hydrolase/OsmC family protein [Porifericola rhodea]WKN31714.1 alpha/beta fold hydrolase [Porifericola rhodea]
MTALKVQFKNKEGLQLAARLEKPANNTPKAYAIFAHCFTCSKNLTAIANISRALTQVGYAVLRFDFAGLGESEGDFADTNFTSNVSDLEAAADYLTKEYEAPKLLIGHSLGGTAVLVASLNIKSAEAVVTIGSPAEPQHVTHLLTTDIDEIEKEGKAEVNIGGRSFMIKKQFLDDLEQVHKHHRIEEIKRPLLILHSPIDNVVSIDNAADIYKQAFHPKSFVSLDQADHLLSNKEDSMYVGNIIASWVSRYIKTQDVTPLKTDKHLVTRTKDSFTTEIMTEQHSLIADEPQDAGGTDLGPSPYELLAASLGACTGMTLRMYADHKKWPLQEVRVHLKHEKIHAEDCKECEEDAKKIDHIERIIEIEGDLDQKQKERLLEIANKCPVHKTLNSPTKIITELREA